MHIHVMGSDGEAKVWLEPAIELASANGIVTLGAEVVQLTPYGIWLNIDGSEYFLAHEDFPWFRDAPIHAVWELEMDKAGNLHWPALDVDLERASLDQLEAYPLVYR